MIIKERVETRKFNNSNIAKNKNAKIRMDFPNDYGIENNNYIHNDYRATNDARYVNQFENYYNYDNNQYFNYRLNASESNEMFLNDDYNIEFKTISNKKTSTKRKYNPRMYVMLAVMLFLTVFVCTLIALNAVPANAENIVENNVVNTERLEENIKNDMNGSIFVPPVAEINNSKNWFDALCDWLSGK